MMNLIRQMQMEIYAVSMYQRKQSQTMNPTIESEAIISMWMDNEFEWVVLPPVRLVGRKINTILDSNSNGNLKI